MSSSSSSLVPYPAIFVNHGGGPMPLMGRQPDIEVHLQDVVNTRLQPKYGKPDAIVVFSAHWESNPIQVTSNPKPPMLFDYYGFPSETYKYKYNAPGSTALADKICKLLTDHGISCEKNASRGYDHGVFVPLMIMYPNADIPVVCVSLHRSLMADDNMKIGIALRSLRHDVNEKILFLGSGQAFHNMNAFFNPDKRTYKASKDFNDWLKRIIVDENKKNNDNNNDAADNKTLMDKLIHWESAPGARLCHPREEHILPLFIIAAVAGGYDAKSTLIKVRSDKSSTEKHTLTAYMFE